MSFKRSVRNFWRKRGVGVKRCLVAFLFGLFHWWVYSSAIGARVEPVLLDYWYQLRGAEEPPKEFVLISVDPATYQHLGISNIEPFPRAVHTKLLERLKQYQVHRVLFDFIFSSKGKDEEVDKRFAEAIGSVRTVIGKYFQLQRFNSLSGEAVKEIEYVEPLEIFSKKAEKVIWLNVVLENGVLRKFILGLEPHKDRPALSALVEDWMKDGAIYPKERDFIKFYGPPGTIRQVSYAKVLTDDSLEFAPFFKDKIVFVGLQVLASAGIAEKDSFITPASKRMMYGVEVLATKTANILHQDWTRRFSNDIEVGVLNVFAVLLMFLLSLNTPLYGLLISALAFIFWATTSYVGFLNGYFIPGVTLMVFLLPSMLIASSLVYYLRMRRSHKGLESALGVKIPLES